jgi:pyruvate dehydrogenase E2 component (dihydrolipoamide acetyltransferase)
VSVQALEFRLPDIGEGIDGADILEWRVAVGDHVEEDQELVEVQTDKAIVVIPSPATGVVTALGVAEGERLDVGAVLAVIEPDAPGAAQPTDAVHAADAVAPPAQEAVGEPAAAPTPAPDGKPAAAASPASAAAPAEDRAASATSSTSPGRAGRPLASPATRRRARELGVDLTAVAASGPQGRILREDVERAGNGDVPAAPAPAPRPQDRARAARAPARPGEVVPLRGVRRAIATTLTRAWQEIPHIIDYREVDATRLLEARGALRRRALDRGDEELSQALTPTPLIAAAAVRALADHPYVNASIDLGHEEITLHGHVNLGIATATPDGLMVPVVRDADQRSVSELALEIAALSHAARERRLRPDQLTGGTFTVNNYGGLGIWLGTPIILPPQVANFGVGAVRDRVVPVDGAPAVRPICALAVSGDHRVLDGHTLGAFVTQVVELLEEPLLIFENLG